MASARRRVLVVDDIEVNRIIICRTLRRLGYHCVECRTGSEALFEFTRHRDSIQCILMDINMPEMDGLEAAFRIRQLEAQQACLACQHCPSSQLSSNDDMQGRESGNCGTCSAPSTPSVPIWAISACSDDEQLLSPVRSQLPSTVLTGPLWRAVGIDAYLSKPVRIRELVSKLAELEERISQIMPAANLGFQSHDKEVWDDTDLRRRCSLSGPANTFVRKSLDLCLEQGSFLVPSKAD